MSYMEKISESEKLDARWFPRYEKTFFEDYEKLSGTKEERQIQKDLFLSGECVNPSLDYPELDSFNLDERERVN